MLLDPLPTENPGGEFASGVGELDLPAEKVRYTAIHRLQQVVSDRHDHQPQDSGADSSDRNCTDPKITTLAMFGRHRVESLTRETVRYMKIVGDAGHHRRQPVNRRCDGQQDGSQTGGTTGGRKGNDAIPHIMTIMQEILLACHPIPQ